MSDDSLRVEQSTTGITCGRCDEPLAVNVTGVDATVEVSPDAPIEVHQTDRYAASIHIADERSSHALPLEVEVAIAWLYDPHATMEHVGDHFGVSQAWVSRAVDRYRQEGAA